MIVVPGKRPIKMWVGTRPSVGLDSTGEITVAVPDVEDAALNQLRNISSLPFVHKNGVAAMPDVHLGKGATVGSVIATRGAIIPAAVGVDIGCGMEAVRTSLRASDLPDSLSGLRDAIEAAVPLGPGGRQNAQNQKLDTLLAFMPRLPMGLSHDFFGSVEDVARQIGTLGSGNHFIEVCLDEEQHVWVMLHSGSRGIGNRIGSHYISKAKELMMRWFISLPDQDLAYLPDGTPEYEEYLAAVAWAQDFARANRSWMMNAVLYAMHDHVGPGSWTTNEFAVSCHHNYVEMENHFGENVWVTRKGAIRARKGDLGIIPGSMGTRSYIVRGLGNPESYHSCSHGAGRRMSRGEAKRRYTVEDLEEQTRGIECRKDASVIDEIPAAYKDIDDVMDNQKDLVEVVHTLRQVLNVKGS